MAEVGQEIRNPRQRERIVFRRTAGETGGRLLRLEMFASPGGAAPPEHLHPRQEERSGPSRASSAPAWAARSATCGRGSRWSSPWRFPHLVDRR